MSGAKYSVRWTDADGKDHKKQYKSEPDARRARKWLDENGATSVDIAIVIAGTPTTIPDAQPKPTITDYQERML